MAVIKLTEDTKLKTPYCSAGKILASNRWVKKAHMTPTKIIDNDDRKYLNI